MKKIRLLIVTLFAFLLFIPLVGCSHDSSGGSDEGSESYEEEKVKQAQPSYSSSHLVDFVWTSESGETFTFYDDGTYCYDGDSGSWGTYKKDTNGNFTLTGEDGSGFYFEISGDSATVYETENGKKKEGAGISFEKINPSCCTVAEVAKCISVLTGDTTYTFVVVDDSETSCSALKTALNGLSSTESVGPYVSLDLTGATQLNISANAFDAGASEVKYALRKVILPEITSIGNFAFRNQAGLQDIEIPSNLSSLGTNAFSGCSSLSSIDLSETSVTDLHGSNYSLDGWGMFYNCTSLSEVSLPSSLTTIGIAAFACCSSLDSIDLSSTKVTKIDDYAFAGSSLESIKLPESLTAIEAHVFSNCTSLTSIDMSKTQVTEIPDGSSSYQTFGNPGMLAGCTKLTTVKFPTGLTRIGDYTFYHCSSLERIDLSSTILKSIGGYAFYKCKSLTNIELPQSLTKIGNRVFIDCPIEEIDLSNVEEIGYQAFWQLSSLTNVTINKTEDMAWGHSKETGSKNSVDNPTSESLDMVEDFEEHAAYYLSGNSSVRGDAVGQYGYDYYWYKVPYT